MNGDKPSLPRGYPLGTLFLLVATCAVILALVALLMREPKRLDDLVVPILISAAVGALLLMVMGIFVGLFHFSQLRGVAWGILVGESFSKSRQSRPAQRKLRARKQAGCPPKIARGRSVAQVLQLALTHAVVVAQLVQHGDPDLPS